MARPPDLPEGYTTRPLRLDDAAAVARVMAAQELADIGSVVIEEADLVGDWQRPSFDLAASSIGVLTGEGELVAYAELTSAERGDAAVHPAHRGRGLGTALAGWMRALAASRGALVVGSPVPQGSPGDRLLTSLGYRVRWTSWVLELPAGAQVPARPLPAGHVVREAAPHEHRACWSVVEDAFLEWSARERQSFEDWAAGTIHRPGSEPWNLRVVVDADHEVVAVAVVLLGEGCGYVDQLATRRDRRGQGLAQALLVDSFAAAADHGATRSELSTDSRTGALGLYERVGMRVTSTWLHRAADLGGGAPPPS